MSEDKRDVLERLRDLRPGYGNIIQAAIDEIDILRAALAAKSVPARLPLWQDIETAPKDKTLIIVCGTYSDDVAIVRWDARKKDWLCIADGVPVISSQGDTWTDYLYFPVPSHWMPCPAAITPTESQPAENKEGSAS